MTTRFRDRLAGTFGLQSVYRRVSPISIYHGVEVPDGHGNYNPQDKAPNVEALRDAIQPGDEVCIIGGGRGVTMTHAAQTTGVGGRVVVYEATYSQTKLLQGTARRNYVEDQTEIRHAIVETPHDLYGEPQDAPEVSTHDLPACDVLELDCEGSEQHILQNLTTRKPRVIIVETHPHQDSPTRMVAELLRARGYTITDTQPDSHSGDVLTATHGGPR